VCAASRLTQPFLRSRHAGGWAPYLIALLLLLAWQRAGAQLAPAEDFFNGGAQLYISNNVPAALEKVELGRKFYPQDEKLKKLEELLKQQQQNQQQNQDQSKQDQQQQSKDDQKQDQQNQQNQQNHSQQQKDEQKQKKQEDQKQKEAAEKKDEPPKDQDQQQASAEKKEGEQKDKPEAEAQPVKPGEMTPEEAKRLLDAQKGNEQLLPMKPDGKPRNPQRPVKDW
jgi:Ca-activated chloride channel family protein